MMYISIHVILVQLDGREFSEYERGHNSLPKVFPRFKKECRKEEKEIGNMFHKLPEKEDGRRKIKDRLFAVKLIAV